MKKSECFQKYGEAQWEKRLQQRREWYRAHVEEEKDGRATRGKPKSRMPKNARDKKRNYKREGNRK